MTNDKSTGARAALCEGGPYPIYEIVPASGVLGAGGLSGGIPFPVSHCTFTVSHHTITVANARAVG